MSCYIGVDVQTSRPPCFAVPSEAGNLIDSGWLVANPLTELSALADRWRMECGRAIVGIDSPRQPLARLRSCFWSRGNPQGWRTARASEVGCGRHCEVVIKSLGLANPQWTPLIADAPEWMQLGFEIFAHMTGTDFINVHEVFPTASLNQLRGDKALEITINFADFALGRCDLLDACIAAATAREFDEGRGSEVGGGDGLGTIILPRTVASPFLERLQDWPNW